MFASLPFDGQTVMAPLHGMNTILQPLTWLHHRIHAYYPSKIASTCSAFPLKVSLHPPHLDIKIANAPHLFQPLLPPFSICPPSFPGGFFSCVDILDIIQIHISKFDYNQSFIIIFHIGCHRILIHIILHHGNIFTYLDKF